MLNSFEFGRSGSPSYNFAADGRKILIGRYNFYEKQTKPTNHYKTINNIKANM